MTSFPHYKEAQEWAKEHRQWLVPSVFALMGTLLFFQGVSNYKEKLGYNMKGIEVIVSAQELPDGHTLVAKDLRKQTVPEKLVPIGVVLVSDVSKVLGHTVTRPITKGEVIFWSAIDVTFASSGPASKIAKGYRSMAVNVDSTSSIGQSVRPGDHVDMLVTLNQTEDSKGPMTFTLLQNIAVLDVGQAEQTDKGNYGTLTLMVLPKEVALITFAEQNGKLNFVLRHPEDQKTPSDLPMIGMSQVVENGFRNSLQNERNETVEIIRGGKNRFSANLP